MKTKFTSILLVSLTLLIYNFNAQTISTLLSVTDSLKGFDEGAALQIGLSKKLVGKELTHYLTLYKKDFINKKYHLKHDHENIVWKTVQTASVQPACSNVDFESGDFTGWTVESGQNNNSLTMAGCCTPGGGTLTANVVNSAGPDPLYPSLSLVSPFGGNKIAKLNDAKGGGKAQRITQTFNVTSTNAIFQIAYAGLLNSGGHDCFEQPYINIAIKDSLGKDLPCPKIVIQAPDPACIPTSTASTAGWNYTGFNNPANDPTKKVYYHDWEIKTIDLSPYIGSNITIQITVGDCIYTAHYGYAYFDCRCLPLEIDLNGTVYDATPQTPINISTCGAISALINAPTGLGPYLWNGPAGSGITGITTQTILVTSPGSYTLTMSPAGSCSSSGSTIKYINLNISPNPTVTNITSQATCSNAIGSGTVNVTSGTAPYTYNWLPSISTNSVGTGLTPGTDYTVTVIDAYGCRNTTTVSVSSFAGAPNYTISPTSGILTCNTNSITLSAITNPTTTIAVWTNTTTTSFVVTSPGTYSCVLTNTLSNCTATVPITITSNTTQPVATYTTSCNINTISLNASSTIGVALGWLAPTIPVSSLSNPGTSTASGIFTLTATNLSNGCKTQYTVALGGANLTVANSPATSVLGCVTTSISLLASTSSPSSTITWVNGATTSTINPQIITSPGTYTANLSMASGCSTKSVITITSNTAASVSITVPTTTISCLSGSLALTANGLVGGPYTYTWIPSQPIFNGNPYSVSNAGTYTVIGTNAVNGCTATANQTVSKETINSSFVADPLKGSLPLSVSFTNTSVNPSGTNYFWDFGNFLTITTSSLNVSTIYNNAGSYPVVLTATKGFCTATSTVNIIVDAISIITIPNVFTPNGDLINDVFLVNTTHIAEINMTIYDRWGLKMTETNSINPTIWDGKTKGGVMVPDGTYFYIIKATGVDQVMHEYKGTVNVFK